MPKRLYAISMPALKLMLDLVRIRAAGTGSWVFKTKGAPTAAAFKPSAKTASIVQKAAELAVQKMTTDVYASVGKSVSRSSSAWWRLRWGWAMPACTPPTHCNTQMVPFAPVFVNQKL